MSWLLVALIPGLLMFATLGLDRVESSLRRDAISANDVAEFLHQAHQDFPDRANPEFQQTRHTNPV